MSPLIAAKVYVSVEQFLRKVENAERQHTLPLGGPQGVIILFPSAFYAFTFTNVEGPTLFYTPPPFSVFPEVETLILFWGGLPRTKITLYERDSCA